MSSAKRDRKCISRAKAGPRQGGPALLHCRQASAGQEVPGICETLTSFSAWKAKASSQVITVSVSPAARATQGPITPCSRTSGARRLSLVEMAVGGIPSTQMPGGWS